MSDATQIELLTAQLKAQHQEIVLLKYEAIKRDLSTLSQRVQMSSNLLSVQEGLRSMMGKNPLPACVLDVNMKWMQRVPTCPYIPIRGKNKGVACGAVSSFSGAAQLNPYCSAHTKQWRTSDLYADYILDYAQAEATDRQRQENEAKQERQKCLDELKENRDGINDLVKRLTNLMADDVDRVLPSTSQEVLSELQDCRESLETTYAAVMSRS